MLGRGEKLLGGKICYLIQSYSLSFAGRFFTLLARSLPFFPTWRKNFTLATVVAESVDRCCELCFLRLVGLALSVADDFHVAVGLLLGMCASEGGL